MLCIKKVLCLIRTSQFTHISGSAWILNGGGGGECNKQKKIHFRAAPPSPSQVLPLMQIVM